MIQKSDVFSSRHAGKKVEFDHSDLALQKLN